MNVSYNYIDEMFLVEAFSITPETISDMVKNNRVISIYYMGGEEDSPGWRTIEPACYGEDLKGRQAIRAWQQAGKTTTKNGSWKFFLVERIRNINLSSNKNFAKRPLFNQKGDMHMRKVFSISDFKNIPISPLPKTLGSSNAKTYVVDLSKNKALKGFDKPEDAIDYATKMNKGKPITKTSGIVALGPKEMEKRRIKVPDIQKASNMTKRLKTLKEIYELY
jgi:hypothetical protein